MGVEAFGRLMFEGGRLMFEGRQSGWCVATLLHGAHVLSLRDEVEPANQNLCTNDGSVNPPKHLRFMQ
jgi:hypothetical protein